MKYEGLKLFGIKGCTIEWRPLASERSSLRFTMAFG
jgi:hypothetical protein